MPVAIGNVTASPAPPPIVIQPTPPGSTDAIVATWYAPDGTVWPLTSPTLGWHTLDEVTAFGAAPVSVTADPNPRGGATVRHIQPEPRLITWPVRVKGVDHTDFLAKWRALMLAFTQTRRLGDGTLVISRPDGTSRLIRARYQDGFAGQPGNNSGWLYDTAVLTLFCPDPYWQSLGSTVITRVFSGTDADYQDPYPTTSNSQTLGDTVAVNPGDVETWPEWVITGPTSGIVATNDLTGESFTLDPNATGIAHGNLLLGETITITTNPPAVRGPDGSIWTAALNYPDAILWALQPGDNPVTFTLTDSDDGASVTLSFPNRYESA